MASDTSDESGCEAGDRGERAPSPSWSERGGGGGGGGGRHAHRARHKHQGDYNTFVVPELLCQCQQRCTERVTPALIQKICMYFFGMRDSREKQKSYLASLILAKEKQLVVKLPIGKRVRKMSYRYFVPILTDKDLKDQSQENILGNVLEIKSSKIGKAKSKIALPALEKDWDHVEVCLKAFTTVHIISEKRVIVTRNVCSLKSTIKCSKPFNKDNMSCPQLPQPSPNAVNGGARHNNYKLTDLPGPSDISKETAAWLTEYCRKNRPFPINPKTYLPEGLILPDSIVCLPIFSDTDYIPSDPDRDIDIVDNFFFNQLWKPEYICDQPSKKFKKSA